MVTDPQHRTRHLLGLVLIGVLTAAACVGLGRWQWSRYQDKSAVKARIFGNYDAPPTNLADVLATTTDETAVWRPAQIRGRYLVSGTVLVRNRPRDLQGKDPTFGFDVVVPLKLRDGGVLLVNRGWVPNSQSPERAGRIPDQVPPPPDGEITAIVTLRRGEPARPQDLPPGQAASIDVAALGSRLLGRQLYGELRSETPTVAVNPLLPERPQVDGGEGINASYAVQWLILAVLSLLFPFWYTRRKTPGSTTRVASRRQWIWDEEDA
jgi:cytochrome oxidase assembly protein ShyY1